MQNRKGGQSGSGQASTPSAYHRDALLWGRLGNRGQHTNKIQMGPLPCFQAPYILPENEKKT